MGVNKKIAEAQDAAPPRRDQSGLCEWRSGIKRCQYPGNCSHATLSSGPYYCRYHIRANDPIEAAHIVELSYLKSNQRAYYPEGDKKQFEIEVQKSLVKFGLERKPNESAHEHAMRCRVWCLEKVRSVGANPPNKDWAKRLLAKHYAGEVLTQGQLSYACEALSLDLKQVKARQPVNEFQQREPGEDMPADWE